MLSTAASLPWIAALLFLMYLVLFFLEIRRRRRPESEKACRAACLIMLAAYLGLYLYLTVLSRSPSDRARAAGLFWSWKEAFRLEGGWIRIARLGLARQILLNIVLYIPLGLLLPCVIRGGGHPWRRSALTGFMLTLMTETAQFILHLGLFEMDDIMHNMTGLFLGFLGLRILLRAAQSLEKQGFWRR